MESSVRKTPIQILHEYGTKVGLIPVYEQEETEGQAHFPIFVFKVTVGEVSSTGQGRTKKAAKHKAAESLLNIMKGDHSISATSSETETETVNSENTIQPPTPPPTQNHCNPVGTLQELAMKKGWRLPEYTLAQECGPPHKREFTMSCRMENFVESGSGTSKKIAKRIAAEKLIAKLQSLPPTCPEIAVKSSCCTWDSLKNSSGEHILSLKRNPLSVSSTDYVKILADLAEEQNFIANYLEIDEQNVNGQFQCLAELSTNPVTVCHGSGISPMSAHNEAAHNALQYLKIMANRK